MPDYNSIQTDRFENLVRHLLGIRNGGVMPAVSPELGVDLNLPALEDVLALADYWRFGFGVAQPAVAAEFGYIGVRNLTTSQLVGVKLRVSAGVAIRPMSIVSEAGIAYDTLLAADSVNWLDTRRLHSSFPLGAGAISIGSGTSPTAPPGLGGLAYDVGRQDAPANTSVEFPLIVLAPGHQALVALDTVNIALSVTGDCWLRDVLPDELAAG